MRTEAQKKVDKSMGLESMDYVFDSKTGKIMQKGVILREFEPETVKAGLQDYKKQLSDLKTEKETLTERLKELKPLIEDRAVKEWLMLQQKAAKVEQKKKIEERLKKIDEDLPFNLDTLAEQERLVKEYEAWLISKPKAAKEAGAK